MDGKIRVAIEDVMRLSEECDDINSIPFEQIIWTENRKDIEIDRTTYRNWMINPLSNMTFIISGAYLREQNRINHFE